MTRINLLPVEFRKAQANAVRVRQIRVVGIALGLLLMGLYGIRTWQILSLRSELESARAERATVEAEIATYADLLAQEQAVASARGVVSSLLAGEISWSEQMLHLATTVPGGFTLTAVSGSSSPDAAPGIVGGITWSANSGSYSSTEAWLVRLSTRAGWANAWLTSAQSAEGGITVNGSVDLTGDAVTARGGGPA